MHTDNIEPLAVLCLHPGISDERVEMQQRGIIELKCQLSFMSLNRFTNLKRYLYAMLLNADIKTLDINAETMAFIYIQPARNPAREIAEPL